MKKVIWAKANDDFTLDLKFNNGAEKRFDATPYLELGIFKDLKDLKYFKSFRIIFGTVQWQNEQDFAPETLYLESVETGKKELVEV